MKVYISILDDEIAMQMRAESEGEDAGTIGDWIRILRPGGSFAGRPYEYWRQLGSGAHEVPDGAEHEVSDAAEHRIIYLNMPSPEEIEAIRRPEKAGLTIEHFLKAPMPDRPIIDRLPEDWHRPQRGGHTGSEPKGGEQ
jgi:hypothetical protein